MTQDIKSDALNSGSDRKPSHLMRQHGPYRGADGNGRHWMAVDPNAPEPPFWLKCAVVAFPLLFVVAISVFVAPR